MGVEGGAGGGGIVAGAQSLQQGVSLGAVADAGLVLADQILDAGDLFGGGAGGDQTHQIGDLHRVVGAHLLLIGDAEQGEGGRGFLGVPLGFDGGQLDLLDLAHAIAGFVTQHDHRDDRGGTEGGGHGEGAPGEADVATLEQVVAGDRQHEDSAGDVARGHGVDELHLGHGVEQQGTEVGQLHAHGHVVELGADRVLHPAVGHQDPQRGEVRAQRHQPGHQQVLALGQAIPAKEEQPDKGGFEEESHQALNGQGRAEDVADIVGVVGPVGAELELHGQAGGDAQGEVDAEQLAPELGHVLVDLAAGHHIDRFHDSQDHHQPQGQGHEDEVIQRGHAELQA